jgi:AraC-like DNA-binding protein
MKTMRRTAAPPARLNGTVFVSETRLLYVGALVATSRHAHHAAQIVIAPEGIDIEDGEGGRARARAVVIPPRVPHGHGASGHAALLIVDGDEPVSRELARDGAPRCESWVRDALDVSVPRDPSPDEARALLASLLDALDGRRPPAPRHPAARRMCAYLCGEEEVALASLAHEAGLSPRQMRDVFARDVGLPMRAYRRWRRVHRAVAAVEEGARLSAAAVAAGFADRAHLSRVFREHFGLAPVQGLRTVRWQTLDPEPRAPR